MSTSVTSTCSVSVSLVQMHNVAKVVQLCDVTLQQARV